MRRIPRPFRRTVVRPVFMPLPFLGFLGLAPVLMIALLSIASCVGVFSHGVSHHHF